MKNTGIDPGSLPKRYQDQIAAQLYATRPRMTPAGLEALKAAGLIEMPVELPPGTDKRLRQSSRPLMNKLEADFCAWMNREYPMVILRPQAKRFELGRGIWYKPDFTAHVNGKETAWECKGPKAFRGGFENLKVAARVWPEIEWFLVWRGETLEWKFQRILP